MAENKQIPIDISTVRKIKDPFSNHQHETIDPETGVVTKHPRLQISEEELSNKPPSNISLFKRKGKKP